MKYDAIIFDLDGTLVPLGFNTQPHLEVIEALKLASQTVKICISTSRPLNYAKPILKMLPINGLSAVNDASQIYDLENDKVLNSLYLEKSVVTDILNCFQKYTKNYMVNTGESEYLFDGREIPENICALCIPEIPMSLTDQIMDDLSSISEIAIHKVLSHKPGLYWVAVTHPLATKLHSVVTIAEYLEIKPENIIGVGDGYTDFPLLSACGLKVAMGNAVPELKAIADFIAPSVEDDGVIAIIEKYILN